MTENKRFTIKPQDDLFGVVDNCSADKVCVINGIRTEIEAKWLCEDMNALNEENKQLRLQLNLCSDQRNEFHRGVRENANRVGKLEKENEQLKKEIHMLKNTIGRNEAYIQQMKHKGEWK